MRPIEDVARDAGIPADALEPRGRHVAKVRLELLERLAARPRGRYVVVTAITPTPLGEGKTTTAIGLVMGLARLGLRAAGTLRQPTLGPVFGTKGGATGGGRCTVEPASVIDLHFTGDAHAVGAAHNLLASLVDEDLFRDGPRGLDPGQVLWRRVTDLSDRALRDVEVDLGHGRRRRTGFDITAAGEVMAILSLATSWADLRARLGRIVVAADRAGRPVTAEDLGAAGAMAVLLRDALLPNLVQTAEGQPVLVHAGPFGNLAHGTSSVVACQLARRLVDVTVTEAGFGADLGFEKLLSLKCPVSGEWPDAAVVVATVRGLKAHAPGHAVAAGHALPAALERPDVPAVLEGALNLRHMLGLVRRAGVPAVVAVNRFPHDAPEELHALARWCEGEGVPCAVVDAFTRGGDGALDLARAVVDAAARGATPRPLVVGATSRERLASVARDVYGADGVELTPEAEAGLARAERWGLGALPVCVAKTPLSLSHDPALRGVPRGFTLPVRAVSIAAGAGFLVARCGAVTTLPGLPAHPRALDMDLDAAGEIHGL